MISRLRFRQCALACLLGSLFVSHFSMAGGLQIAPVMLTLQPDQNADGIWLSNTSSTAINAQVRVYHWSQSGFADRLTPSGGLVISPPMLELPPGGRQLIRVIRSAPPSGAVEDAYRLSIDELPPSKLTGGQLQFVLHYSSPVFVQPAGHTESAASLQWQLRHIDGKTFLDVNNQGNSHAQLSALTWVNASGARKVITPGLLGYVLPGSTMRWILASSDGEAQRGGKVEVTVNGQETVQHL